MINRTATAAFAAFMFMQSASLPAFADNQVGYQMLTAEQVQQLPRGGGKLGLNVGRGQQITSSGLTFELLRVNTVTPRSPSARAGLRAGDQIVAVDGRVFPNVAAFAAYVGSMPPAKQISVDYMPPNGGPEQAQRVSVTLAGGTGKGNPQEEPRSTGLSTGTKVAIGLGAAALFGCYKMGCFSRRSPNGSQPIGAKP